MYILMESRMFCWFFPLYPFTFHCLYAVLTATCNSSYRLTTNSKEWITVDVVVPTKLKCIIFGGKDRWSKLVSQNNLDCFVINFFHMIVYLPDCCIFLTFFVWYHLLIQIIILPNNVFYIHQQPRLNLYINQVRLNIPVLFFFMWLINTFHVSFQMLFVTCI